MYYIYILKSKVKRWYYVGMTDDTNKRLMQHNSGLTKSTRPYKPFDIVYTEKYVDKITCRKRELFIKNNHALKKDLINQIEYGAIV